MTEIVAQSFNDYGKDVGAYTLYLLGYLLQQNQDTTRFTDREIAQYHIKLKEGVNHVQEL